MQKNPAYLAGFLVMLRQTATTAAEAVEAF